MAVSFVTGQQPRGSCCAEKRVAGSWRA